MTSWINPACFQLAERARQRRRRLLFQKLHPGRLSKSLGQGAYSTAFRIGHSKVCKITDIQDPTLCWFGRYVRRFPNPHWPRIHRQIQLGNSHFVTWMERLRPLDRASKGRVCCVNDFISNAGTGGASRLEELAQFGFGRLARSVCGNRFSTAAGRPSELDLGPTQRGTRSCVGQEASLS